MEYIWHAGVIHNETERDGITTMSLTFKWGEITTIEEAIAQREYIKGEVLEQAEVEATKVTIMSISKLGEAA